MISSKLFLVVIGSLLFSVGEPTKTQSPNKSITQYVDIRWYDAGEVTASGEKFDPNSLTCASKSLKFGTLVDLECGSVILSVRCNDRGPNLIELTKGAFSKIGDPKVGVLRKVKAKIQIMIEKYIPSGQYGERVAAILKPYENELYAVGSNGRNKAYDLKADVKGYDFVYDCSSFNVPEVLIDTLSHEFPDKVNRINVKPPTFTVDCETFFLTLRIQPVATFLRTVKYAGDMLAVAVQDGAIVCCPEFMTVPPMIQVRKTTDEDSSEEECTYDANHKIVLQTFHDDIVKSISKDVKEPSTA